MRLTWSVRGGRLRLREPGCLILDVHGHLRELAGVLPGVVGAEQQLSTAQGDANVGLGTARVTAVGRGQWGQRLSSHISM